MKTILQQVKIIDEASPHHLQKVDILIENATIISIENKIEASENTTVYNFDGLCLSLGFCDLITQIGEPGFEYRDDIESVANSAIKGGFTTICALPNNKPITQTKSSAEFIRTKSKNTAIDILPLGALTKDFDGKTPTEMFDLNNAGVVAFTDIPHTISDNGVLLRSLQYTQQFGACIFSLPYDKNLINDGQVNESAISVRMGFKGVPDLAEYVSVYQQLEVLKYAGGNLHLTGISTKAALQLIAEAKQSGLSVTASCFVHHLVATENDVLGYHSNFKVFPPLRDDSTRLALIEAVKNKTIDAITTQHTPLDVEVKNLEFEYADAGMLGLETALGLLLKYTDISLERLVDALAVQPRKILNRTLSVTKNSKAEFVIFNPDENWTFEEKDIRSKSNNTPFVGKTLKGKVKAIFNKDNLVVVD